MEFNAGIFSFTGTRKSPLNIFPLRPLTGPAPARGVGRAPETPSIKQFFHLISMACWL
jgi:hypothetical protein